MNPQISPFLLVLLKEIVLGLLCKEGSYILVKRGITAFYWNPANYHSILNLRVFQNVTKISV